MYTSTITKAEKATLQEDGSMFLDVEFNILQDHNVTKEDLKTNPKLSDKAKVGDVVSLTIDTKRLAFSPDTSSEDIIKEVRRYVENYSADAISVEVNKERDEVLAQADATIEDIIGAEIK